MDACADVGVDWCSHGISEPLFLNIQIEMQTGLFYSLYYLEVAVSFQNSFISYVSRSIDCVNTNVSKYLPGI